MREFAKATILEIEKQFGVSRADWDKDSAQQPNDAIVRFFLESPDSTGGAFIYHAMVDFGVEGTSDPVRYGSPEEIPIAWLDADVIKFYFEATPEEFASPGFLSRYFAD